MVPLNFRHLRGEAKVIFLRHIVEGKAVDKLPRDRF
jgi:hypothetical protein